MKGSDDVGCSKDCGRHCRFNDRFHLVLPSFAFPIFAKCLPSIHSKNAERNLPTCQPASRAGCGRRPTCSRPLLCAPAAGCWPRARWGWTSPWPRCASRSQERERSRLHGESHHQDHKEWRLLIETPACGLKKIFMIFHEGGGYS